MKSERLDLCNEIINTCIKMESSGINQGTSGNLSARYKNGFLITPSSLPYNEMSPEDIVEMNWNGEYLWKHTSSEWRFHRDIYVNKIDAQAIVHAHSPHATAVSSHGKPIPPFHYMIALAGGEDIKCADYATFGTQELSNNVLVALKDRLACLISQHGMICLGKTFGDAFFLGCEVEAISKMYVKTLSIGNSPILSDEEMHKVIQQMKRMSYGKGPEPEGSNDIAKPKSE